jgi:acetoin:2,6-dichlorophenolindophenol oxidoreductase subunit alpha
MPDNKEQYKKLYWMMKRIRLCEESLIQPITEDIIKCPVHLYSGQEAIATGVCAALNKEDFVFGNHRSHGHFLAKGGDMSSMIAEIYGKVTGCSSGRGGSMHLIDPENGIVGVTPIVTGSVSLALGAALASKVRGDKIVTVSFFGDGATGEGGLYESMNFAALKKLPLIFICENNLYSTHLPVTQIRVNKKISDIALPFKIKASTSDGNDVLNVYKLAKQAVNLCRSGKGPVFLEFVTFRLRGHVGPSDTIQGSHKDIRPKEQIAEWKKRDPIIGFKNFLLLNHHLTEDELSDIDKTCLEEVEEANRFAISSNYPDKSDLLKYVFKE